MGNDLERGENTGKTKKIVSCPHCGSTEGFYTRTNYIGVPYRMGFNGEEKDNSEMYDNALEYKEKRYAYCINCDEVICTAKRIHKQID